MKITSIKNILYITCLFFINTAFLSCSKKSNDLNIDDEYEGNITFTARDESVTCSPTYNEAGFQRTSDANYKRRDYNFLYIQGHDEEAPTHHESSISIHMVTTGSLQKGTYPIIDTDDLSSFYYGTITDDPDKVAGAIASANDELSSNLWGTKDVRSTGGGTLVINDIQLGKHNSEKGGYQEGFISGTFEFGGTNYDKTSTGNCKGKFEHIPIEISDDSKF